MTSASGPLAERWPVTTLELTINRKFKGHDIFDLTPQY